MPSPACSRPSLAAPLGHLRPQPLGWAIETVSTRCRTRHSAKTSSPETRPTPCNIAVASVIAVCGQSPIDTDAYRPRAGAGVAVLVAPIGIAVA